MKNLFQTSTTAVIAVCLLFSACKKYDEETNVVTETSSTSEFIQSANGSHGDHGNHKISGKTIVELLKVRLATQKYLDINKAKADGYLDAELKLPNMGYHFLKSSLVTAEFNLTKPPILVYNKKLNGKFELVAVEYAIPIDFANPNKAPQGFTGDADMWHFNTLNTGWWTLHAWVWKINPDGVFNMTNPLVIVR